MKTKELCFSRVQKSAQGCETKGDRLKKRWKVGKFEGWDVREKEVERSKLGGTGRKKTR
jgi:hypothetical protein